jgi:hypothetical protein
MYNGISPTRARTCSTMCCAVAHQSPQRRGLLCGIRYEYQFVLNGQHQSTLHAVHAKFTDAWRMALGPIRPPERPVVAISKGKPITTTSASDSVGLTFSGWRNTRMRLNKANNQVFLRKSS